MDDLELGAKETDAGSVDAERRKALKRYASVVAGGSFVALSAQEVLADASYQGRINSGGQANDDQPNQGGQ